MRELSFVLIFIFSATACSTDEKPKKENFEFHNKLETRNFTIMAPEGWELIEEQGIDTYIGRITNNNITIYFDQGSLAFRGLEFIEETNESIYLKNLVIDGVPAVLHKKYTPQDTTSEAILTLYLDKGIAYRNRLYVFDPENEDLILQILKTHRFKKSQ